MFRLNFEVQTPQDSNMALGAQLTQVSLGKGIGLPCLRSGLTSDKRFHTMRAIYFYGMLLPKFQSSGRKLRNSQLIMSCRTYLSLEERWTVRLSGRRQKSSSAHCNTRVAEVIMLT